MSGAGNSQRHTSPVTREAEVHAVREAARRRPLDGEVLAAAFEAAINGTERQLRAFIQLCALEGI